MCGVWLASSFDQHSEYLACRSTFSAHNLTPNTLPMTFDDFVQLNLGIPVTAIAARLDAWRLRRRPLSSDAMTRATPAFGAAQPVLPSSSRNALLVGIFTSAQPSSRKRVSARTARKRPRCALPGVADAAEESSAIRVLKAAESGRVARAGRLERAAARAKAKKQETSAKVKAAAAKMKEKETAAAAKVKERESAAATKARDKEKDAAAAASAKAKVVEKKETDMQSAAAKKKEKGKERKEPDAQSHVNTTSKKKAVESRSASDADTKASGTTQSSPSASLSPGAPSKPSGGGILGKQTSDGDDSELEFFVASRDSPNVSAPPNELPDDGSVLGRTQALGNDALPLYSAGASDEATSPLSAADPAISAMYGSNAAGTDAAASSLTPPTALTPSLSAQGASDDEQEPSVGGSGAIITDTEPRLAPSSGKSGEGSSGKERPVASESANVGRERTPRAFSITRVRNAGSSARREVTRVISESNVMTSLRMPSRRDVARFACDGMLVVTLVLLLHTGVSRTLRWIHTRLEATRGASKPSFPYEQSVFECMQRPLEFVSIFTVGTALAEAVSRPLAAAGLVRYIRTLRELGVIVGATWFLLRWIDRIRLRFAVDKRIDKAQVDATSRVATVVTTVIAILISLDTVGVNVQTVLAFGGIGGVAIGFAGREIISNFFGGFMIFLTRPFSVGEWIRSIEESELNGTVEDIGWYLTRVRTWDKRPLYIPNSRFSTLIVENPSRMSNRRILHYFHLRLEDMPVVKDVVSSIDHLLKQHPDLDPKQHRLAYVDSFDDYSVKIWMSCYTKSVFLFDWRRVQQELLLSAYGIVREHGARLATSTTRDVRPGSDPDRYGPLGNAASFRNRQVSNAADTLAPVPFGAKVGSTRAGEDHLDGNIVPSVVADIESGLISDEELSTAAAAAVARENAASVSHGLGTGTSRNGATSESGASEFVPATTSAASSGPPTPTPGSVGVGAGSGDFASAVAGLSGTGNKLKNSGLPPTAADALEIVVAAIMKARNNQVRSDGRQTGNVTVPSSRDPEATDSTTTMPNGVPSGASSGSAVSPSAAATGSGSGIGVGGPIPGDVGQASGGVPPSTRPTVAGASGKDDNPQAGQMKISAAPRIGSSSTSSPAASSSAAAPAPPDVLKDGEKDAGSGSKPSVGLSSGAQGTVSGAASRQPSSSSPLKPAPQPSPPASPPVQREMNITAAPKVKAKPSPPPSSGNPSSSPSSSGKPKGDRPAEKKSKRKKGD